jgi:hypothetical protein
MPVKRLREEYSLPRPEVQGIKSYTRLCLLIFNRGIREDNTKRHLNQLPWLPVNKTEANKFMNKLVQKRKTRPPNEWLALKEDGEWRVEFNRLYIDFYKTNLPKLLRPEEIISRK